MGQVPDTSNFRVERLSFVCRRYAIGAMAMAMAPAMAMANAVAMAQVWQTKETHSTLKFNVILSVLWPAVAREMSSQPCIIRRGIPARHGLTTG